MNIETYTESEIKEIKKIMRFAFILFVMLVFLIVFALSNVSAASCSVTEEFVESGASLIVQPIWPEGHEEEPEPVIPAPVISVSDLEKLFEEKWYYFVLPIFAILILLGYKRHGRKGALITKRIERREEDGTEEKDKLGNALEKRRTTVPGRKGVFRRVIK